MNMLMETAVRNLGGAWPGDQSVTANLYLLNSRYTTGDCRAGTIHIGTRTEFDECARRLRNEPSFNDHPDAKCFAQSMSGKWFKNTKTNTVMPMGDTWYTPIGGWRIGVQQGEVIGDWRDTLRLRPEEKKMEAIIIGPCKCGGYGQVYDEKTEAELGRCHDDLKTVLARQENKTDWRQRGEFPPVGTVCAVRYRGSWRQTKIIGWDDDVIVITTDRGACTYDSYVTARPEDFRPLQTEREQWIEKAKRHFAHDCDTEASLLSMYNDGLGKMPEGK